VAAEEGRSDSEVLEFSTAIIDLAIAIEPSTRQSLEPLVPSAVRTWRDLDPEGWRARVDAMSTEEASFFHELLAEPGLSEEDDPPS
jgi:hypothetical protein